MNSVSLPPLGAILGSLLSSVSLNFAGRKLSILLTGFIFLLSFLIIGLASIPSSVEMVLAGRAISGLAVGLAVPSTAVYVSECSSSTLRSIVSALPAVFLSLGVFVAYVAGKLTSFY